MLKTCASIFHNNASETFSFFKRNQFGFNALNKSTRYFKTTKNGYSTAKEVLQEGNRFVTARKVYTKKKGYNEDNTKKKKHAFP